MELGDKSECDEMKLGSISDYDEETLDAANQAFFLWEERDYEAAKPFLKIAAEKRHSYSISKYALLLLDEKNDNIEADVHIEANLMLMAAVRKEEMAMEFITDLKNGCTVFDIVKEATTSDIVEWLRTGKSTILHIDEAIDKLCWLIRDEKRYKYSVETMGQDEVDLQEACLESEGCE